MYFNVSECIFLTDLKKLYQVKMTPIFDGSSSNCLTKYKQILSECVFKHKNLLNVNCLSMKFNNRGHINVQSLPTVFDIPDSFQTTYKCTSASTGWSIATKSYVIYSFRAHDTFARILCRILANRRPSWLTASPFKIMMLIAKYR